jgi:hypothetical protein
VKTSPSNETHDEWSDAPTMAGSIPTTMASRTATGFDVTPPTAARPYVPDLAWSAESPEIAEPRSPQRPRRWSMRSGVLTFVGGGLIAAAAAGIFGALHGLQSTPVRFDAWKSDEAGANPFGEPWLLRQVQPAVASSIHDAAVAGSAHQ